MANKALFNSYIGKLLGHADTVNREGAPAFELGPKAKLAQLAVTGTLSPTFYAEAQAQLDAVIALAGQVPPEFLAKAAIYARRSAPSERHADGGRHPRSLQNSN